MSQVLDEENLKALTLTTEWEKYLESKRSLAATHSSNIVDTDGIPAAT